MTSARRPIPRRAFFIWLTEDRLASAFALTLAYLGEQCSAIDAGDAFAASLSS
jgi:hypothetical protein